MNHSSNETDDHEGHTDYAPPWIRSTRRAQPESAEFVSARPSEDHRLGFVDPTFTGDRAIVALQRRLALDPDQVPEPPRDNGKRFWPVTRRISALVGVSALVAWGIVSVSTTRTETTKGVRPERPPESHFSSRFKIVASPLPASALDEGNLAAAIQPSAAAASTVPIVQPATVVASVDPTAAPTVAVSSPQPVAMPAAEALAPPASTPADPIRSQSDSAIVKLDGDVVAMLVKRGKDFFASGDVTSARLLLQRAATAGSAEAAFILGTTYDPHTIHRMGILGVTPDIASARQWYQKAAALGSTAASQPLADLERLQ